MLWILLIIAGLVLVIVPGLFVHQVVLGIAILAFALLLLGVNLIAANAARKAFQRHRRRIWDTF